MNCPNCGMLMATDMIKYWCEMCGYEQADYSK